MNSNKTYVLKNVKFGKGIFRQTQAFKFETLKSYLARGGKINRSTNIYKFKYPSRNPLGSGFSKIVSTAA